MYINWVDWSHEIQVNMIMTTYHANNKFNLLKYGSYITLVTFGAIWIAKFLENILMNVFYDIAECICHCYVFIYSGIVNLHKGNHNFHDHEDNHM